MKAEVMSWHSGVRAFIQYMTAVGFEMLFPAICCCCGRVFKLRGRCEDRVSGTLSGLSFGELVERYFCGACAEKFDAVQSPLCLHCGQPFASSHGPDHVCGSCRERPFRFQSARAAGLYQGALREAIHQLKYHGREQLALPLGRLLWQTFIRHWDAARIDRVIPVPLHPRRLRKRGFNQALLLLRGWPALAERSGMRVPSHWIDARILKRCRPTLPQTGLKRDQRKTNLKDAFRVTPDCSIHEERILLVDDVMTTGTTADICARTLLQAGAAEVRVLTLARAVTAGG